VQIVQAEMTKGDLGDRRGLTLALRRLSKAAVIYKRKSAPRQYVSQVHTIRAIMLERLSALTRDVIPAVPHPRPAIPSVVTPNPAICGHLKSGQRKLRAKTGSGTIQDKEERRILSYLLKCEEAAGLAEATLDPLDPAEAEAGLQKVRVSGLRA